MADETKIVARIITPNGDRGLLSSEITGMDQPIQAIQVDVSSTGQDAIRHLIISAYYPKMELNLCKQLSIQLREYFGKTVVCFTRTNEDGKADVFTPSIQRNDRQALLYLAAAVAVVKKVCGWDESEWIEVKCESTKEQIKVSPMCNGEEFIIKIYS